MFGIDELGMDLGTSTLHIVVRGKGLVLSEPAYVTYDRQTRDVVAVGEEASRMVGRTPAGLVVERPLRDFDVRVALGGEERIEQVSTVHVVVIGNVRPAPPSAG